ncbi:MAG: hypothetical protein KDH17_08370 [Rhodocyclaceae bacterium]|nr:hypothetical protein [Rhodocyclaceae bacterium]
MIHYTSNIRPVLPSERDRVKFKLFSVFPDLSVCTVAEFIRHRSGRSEGEMVEVVAAIGLAAAGQLIEIDRSVFLRPAGNGLVTLITRHRP